MATGLRDILKDAAAHDTLSKQTGFWAQGYSLEKLKESLGSLLANRWGYKLKAANLNIRPPKEQYCR